MLLRRNCDGCTLCFCLRFCYCSYLSAFDPGGGWLFVAKTRNRAREQAQHPKDSPFRLDESWKPRGEIVPYSRKFPEQDRAIEAVLSLIRLHPDGVTVSELNELMSSHRDKIRSDIAWFHSIDVLIDEGRVYSCAKWREKGYLESFKLFAK